MIGRRFAFLVLFACLTAGAALLLNRVMEPAISADLLTAAGLGLLVGLPGFIHRRLGFLSPVLLLVGAYVLLRIFAPLPEGLEGWRAEYLFYAEELRDGLLAYADALFPLTLAGVPGLKVLVLIWVYLVSAGAATLALGGGRLLAGTGTLLGLLAFTFTVDDLPRDTWAVLGVLLLVVLLLVAAQGLNRRRWGMGDLVTGVVVGGTSVAVAFLVLGGAPGLVQQGWQDWRDWDPFGRGGGEEIVFNWKQNYPRLLDPRNNFPVMRVISPRPSYWRANTLDYFTGDVWLSEDSSFSLAPLGDGRTRRIVAEEAVPPGEEVVQLFDLEGVSTTFLFSGGFPREITLDGVLPVYVSPAGVIRAQHALRPPVSYRVSAVIPRLKPADLTGRGRDYTGVPEKYFQLPLPTAGEIARVKANGGDWEARVASASPRGQEFLGIYELNQAIIGEASDPYEVALLVERHLRTGYDYSLELPPSDYRSPYAAFVFDTRLGYCQQFSGIMALLLRLNGIPARVAVGFTTGKALENQTYEVATNNAHAWVEVYFPGVGWLPFDPTPGRNLPLPGVSSASPGFIDPFEHTRGGAAGGLPADQRRNRIPEAEGDVAGEVAQMSAEARALRGALVLVLSAGVVLGWPRARRRWRERVLHRGPPEERLAASLRLLRSDLTLWAVPARAASTLEEIALLVKAEAGCELQEVFSRVQRLLYGGRPASAADVEWLERSRAEVNRALGRARGRFWRLSVAYGGGRFLLAMRRDDRLTPLGRRGRLLWHAVRDAPPGRV